jgi:acetoacetate decarboxylase
LKLIPSVKRGAKPDVAQLTSTALGNVNIKQAFEGKATLEFGMSPVDPLHKIPIENVLGGNYINLDFTLTYGDIIHDYLTAGR